MRLHESVSLAEAAAAICLFISRAQRCTGRMRLVPAIVAAILAMGGAGFADPYKWCAVDSNGGGTNCGFVTVEQCRATVSGQGGFCEPKQVVPANLSPAAKAAAPKTNPSGSTGLMDCVTESCRINCSPKVAKRFRPKWCRYFKEPPDDTPKKSVARGSALVTVVFTEAVDVRFREQDE